MITRRLTPTLEYRLRQFPAVALLGPHQVGKTTLAMQLHTAISIDKPIDYLDLENPADLHKLDDATGYLRDRPDRLLIIDEVQRAPELFQVLRGVIDQRRAAGEMAGLFLLLGSASIDLLHQSSESLAGRIAYLELSPLDILEVDPDLQEQLWVRGGFPLSFLAEDNDQSMIWRRNFIATYLERDIPQLGTRVPAETLRRFWTMLAHSQGSLLNAAQIAGSLGVDGKTVTRYLDLMVDLLLVRRLQPYHSNTGKRLVKSPKIYIRDSGIVHTLLRLDTREQILGHPIAGMSWEGHVIETLLRVAPAASQPNFYRTAAGAEVDLVLELPGDRLWAIEIKRSLTPTVARGFHNALEDLQPDRQFLVYSGDERYMRRGDIEVIGLRALAEELAALSSSPSF